MATQNKPDPPEKRHEIAISRGTWHGEDVAFRTGRVVIKVKVETRRPDPEQVLTIAKRLAEQVRYPIRAGPQRRETCNPIIRRSVRRSSCRGQTFGRLERSRIPSLPCTRYRPAHRRAVVTETLNRSAARRRGHSSSTMHRARRRRPVGVSGALALR